MNTFAKIPSSCSNHINFTCHQFSIDAVQISFTSWILVLFPPLLKSANIINEEKILAYLLMVIFWIIPKECFFNTH